MLKKNLKAALMYLLILAAGLGAGYLVVNIPKWLKSPYVEGNYAAYYPNAQTKVVVYGTSTCPYCLKTREFLHAKNITFIDYDVQKSDRAQKELAQLGVNTVPVVLIGDRQIRGFNQAALESALKKVGL